MPFNEVEAPTRMTTAAQEEATGWTQGEEGVEPDMTVSPRNETDSSPEPRALTLTLAASSAEEPATRPTEPTASVNDLPAPAMGGPGPRAVKAPVPALGEILLERKLLTSDQLRAAMDRHRRTRRRLGRVLVEMGYATADAVLEALSAQLGVPSTRVNAYTVNPEAVKMLPEKVARKHMAFPLLRVGTTLVVAIASPKDLHALDDLRFASGCGIQTMVALEVEILAALDRYYGNQWVPNEQEDAGVVVIDLPGPAARSARRGG